MHVTIGNISPGSAQEMPPQPGGDGRKREKIHSAPPAAGGSRPASAESLEGRRSSLEDLRNRLLLLQADVARAQRQLGGLEEVAELLRAPANKAPIERSVQQYVATATYRGQPVLRGLAEDLHRIARERDERGLDTLIEKSRAHLGRLAQELSRYETAQQNSRALAVGRDPLESLKQGIRREGSALLEVRRENVLRLLG